MFYKIKPWIPTIIFVLAFVVSISVNAYEKIKYEDWTTTVGTVTLTRKIDSTKKSFLPDEIVIDYDYSVNEKDYQGISSYFFNISEDECIEGKSYQIWYNPKNPEESAFLDPHKASVADLPIIVASSYIIFYLIRFLATKKKSK